MAKMLMGQIDHARKRVEQLKKDKYGDVPKGPKLKAGSSVKREIRAGTLNVSGPQIKRAFDAYMAKTPLMCVDKHSGNYSNDYKDSYTLDSRAPTSTEDALASEIYLRVNQAEADRYADETKLYNLRQEAINIKATDVEDAIVLGDQAAALIALKEFADYDVDA